MNKFGKKMEVKPNLIDKIKENLVWCQNKFTFIFHRPSIKQMENKGKFILTEIHPSVQKHDIYKYCMMWS